MGNYKSLIWTENASGNYASVDVAGSPSPKRKQHPVVLNDDPRSPTISIPRTPIEIVSDEGTPECAPEGFRMSKTFSYNDWENANNPREDAATGAEEGCNFITGITIKPSAPTGNPKKGQEAGFQRTPLRDYSKPSLYLRYKQAKQAGKSLKDEQSLKNNSEQQLSKN